MSYHPFERIVSLWLQRVKGHYVIENFPIRYDRDKIGKYSPGTATTDIDLISYNILEPNILNVYECKSNINETFHNNSRDRLIRQLEELDTLVKLVPFYNDNMKIKKYVIGIKIADRIKRKLDDKITIIDGEKFKKEILEKLLFHIGDDCKIDPKDDLMSIIRLFWHFGMFNDEYYLKKVNEIMTDENEVTPSIIRDELGLFKGLKSYCKILKNKVEKKSS